MKIGFLSYFTLRAGEGFEHWLNEVTNKLSLEHEISILTSNKGPRRWNIQNEFKGINVVEQSFSKSILLPFSRENKAIKRFFKESDLVYSLYFTSSHMSLGLDAAVYVLQSLTGTPVIFGHHNPNDWYNANPSLTGKVGNRIGKKIEAHHALNEETKQGLLKWGIKKVYKIPNGVNTYTFKPLAKFDRFSLLFVGSLEKRKGVEQLPTVVSSLVQRIRDFDFYIIGNGEMSSVFDALKSNPRVKWLGFVDEKTKRELYSSCHVLVAPSKAETFMMTGLEAMASGTPVVTSDIAGPKEYVINNVNGYLTRDSHEIVEKLVSMFHSWKKGENDYYQLTVNARKTAEEFDWTNILPKLENMFKEVSRA